MGAIKRIVQLLLGSIIVMSLSVMCISLIRLSGSRSRRPLYDGEHQAGLVEYLDRQLPGMMKSYKIPGLSIAVIREGKTVWTEAYGYADLETEREMTVDTRCRVESISKSVTAWGIMKLVEEGSIDPDEPIACYLSESDLPVSLCDGREVTVRHLLSHTSGLALGSVGVRYSPYSELPSIEEHLTREIEWKEEPGSSFFYSNTGYILLELIIENVTGEKFNDFISREIIKPLGMEKSSFVWSGNWEPGVPSGYDVQGRVIPVYVYPDKAAGGLFAPVDDIAEFVAAGMTGAEGWSPEVLDNQTIERMYRLETDVGGYYSVVFPAYGLGHWIEFFSDGKYAVSHGGQGSGWMTHFHSFPETGDGIVLLSNSQRSWPLFSEILSLWGEWSGYSSIGMGMIGHLTFLFRIFLALFSVTIAVCALRIIVRVERSRRYLFRQDTRFQFGQAVSSVLAVILTAAVITVSRLEYFFLDSVFPSETPILKFNVLLTSALLAVHAVMPARRKRRKRQENLRLI